MSAGAPVDLDTLDEQLGSEAIIFASSLDVVLAPSTVAETKVMLSRAKEHTYDSVSNGAHR